MLIPRVIRIGRTREIVASYIARMEARVSVLAEEIAAKKRREEEQLVTAAESYLMEQEQIRQNLRRIESLAGGGHLPPAIVMQMQAECARFTSRSQEDPRLARGIELYNFRLQQQESAREAAEAAAQQPPVKETAPAAPAAPELLVPQRPSLSEVILPDGAVVEVRSLNKAKYIEGLLLGTEEKPVTLTELTQEVFGAEGRQKLTALGDISYIKRILESVGWRVVQVTTRQEFKQGRPSAYYLEKIEAINEGNPTEQKTAGQSDLDGSLPESTGEILSPLTPRQISILCTEIQRKNGYLLRYGTQVVKFIADDPCLDVCQKLDRQQGEQNTPRKQGLRSRQITNEREEALRVMRDLVAEVILQDSENNRGYFDSFPADIQHLVYQFIEWETQVSATNLYAFLASTTDENRLAPGEVGYDDACVREYKGPVRVWDVRQPFPETKKAVAEAPMAAGEAEEDYRDSDLEAVDLTPAPRAEFIKRDVLIELPDVAEIKPVKVPPSADRKQKAIERQSQREQIRKERIKDCLDQIYAAIGEHELVASNDGTWNGAAVVRSFNSLTGTMMRGLIERGILEPETKKGSRVRGNTPAYSIADIAVALYFHKYDRQLTSGIAKDLKEMAEEEISKRESEKNKKI